MLGNVEEALIFNWKPEVYFCYACTDVCVHTRAHTRAHTHIHTVHYQIGWIKASLRVEKAQKRQAFCQEMKKDTVDLLPSQPEPVLLGWISLAEMGKILNIDDIQREAGVSIVFVSIWPLENSVSACCEFTFISAVVGKTRREKVLLRAVVHVSGKQCLS